MPSTGTVTTTRQSSDLPPASAVIVALPPPVAVTLPEASTLATLPSELDHVTVLSVASEGSTVAVRVSECPLSRYNSILSIFTEDTATSALTTVISQEAVLPLTVTVILVLPGEIAVTNPDSVTVATECLEEAQVMALKAASDGETTASSCNFSPAVIWAPSGVMATEDTGTNSSCGVLLQEKRIRQIIPRIKGIFLMKG